MVFVSAALSVLALAASSALARRDHDDHDHDHSLSKRLPPSSPLTLPYRPLTWGDTNIIATTDTHGWLLGHQHTSFPEPDYSGDLGDFYSFVEHMKQIALEKDVDLLLVDSGDVHDGTGLSDGYPPGGVDAHESNKYLELLPYDLMTVGNHELYDYEDAYDMYQNFIPHFKGRYLSSNVNITVFGEDGEPVTVPLGNRFVKFTTRKGRSVTSLGVLYDFDGNDVNTTVQYVADMVKEQWFLEAIAEAPDFFLLVGHMPVSYDNWPTVFNAIRAVHKYTPILIFGGHSHIRDCQQYDGRSMALESGRYMETIGWMSADLDPAFWDEKMNVSFTRRYLDQNRITYEYHTGVSNYTYDTKEGKNITKGLEQLAVNFDLSYLYGYAPQDYFLSAAPYPSNNSVLSLWMDQVLPVSLSLNNSRADIPRIIIDNSGELRFDVYSGTFTKNDQLTASPFTDSFLYIPNMTFSMANQVLPALNGDGSSDRKRSLARRPASGDAEVDRRYKRWVQEMDRRELVEWGWNWGHPSHPSEPDTTTNLTLGYVTTDSCPGAGDDTQHIAVAYYDVPDYLASTAPNVTDDTPIDLVFVNFIESDVLDILNSLQSDYTYTENDTQLYSPVLADEAFGLFAQQVWTTPYP